MSLDNETKTGTVNGSFSYAADIAIAPDNSSFAILDGDGNISVYSMPYGNLKGIITTGGKSVAKIGYLYNNTEVYKYYFTTSHYVYIYDINTLSQADVLSNLGKPSMYLAPAHKSRALFYVDGMKVVKYSVDNKTSNSFLGFMDYQFVIFKDDESMIGNKLASNMGKYSLTNGSKITSLGSDAFNVISEIIWNPKSNSLFFGTSGALNTFRFEDLKVESKVLKDLKCVSLDKSSGNVLYLEEGGWGEPVKYKIFNTSGFKFTINGVLPKDEDILNKTKYLLSAGGGYILRVMDLTSKCVFSFFDYKTGKKLKEFDYSGLFQLANVSLSAKGEYVIYTANNGDTHIYDVKKNANAKYLKIDGFMPFVSMSEDTRRIAYEKVDWVSSSKKIAVLNWAKDSMIALIEVPNLGAGSYSNFVFSADGKYLACSCNNTVFVLDINSKSIVKQYMAHNSAIYYLTFAYNDKYVVSKGIDNQIKVAEINSPNWIAVIPPDYNTSEWIVYTNDGYWDSSLHGGNLVALVQGTNSWNIDQFAYKYNRPDIILSRLPNANIDLVNHFEKQYKKRLAKMGLSEDGLSSDTHVPEVTNLNMEGNGYKKLIRASLSDIKFDLKSYNIFVNDVPLFGARGKSVSGKSIDIADSVQLSGGDNKLEISCINEKGAESFRATLNIYKEDYSDRYDKKPTKDLYFLGFGVSVYKNSQLNLSYAHKDAQDLGKLFESMNGKGFRNVYTKVLTNEQVTPENIKNAKEFLKDAKPDDVFVLFIAGHGLHDNDAEATYYYLTYNTELNNLAGTAANFDFIEDILQGIPPRNKLFLMDACESGEIDNDVEIKLLAASKSRGLKSRGFKSVTQKSALAAKPEKSVKRPFLYQKDRFIYNDLQRRSGSIVFSSSKGGELSYEFDNIQNGLFTEYIIKALSGSADNDNNGIVTTDELREYVNKEVSKISGDAQHPTVDRDNIYQKFGFGVK
jgi:hypothetical protein